MDMKYIDSEIWAIAGGKGGTGKSFLTSQMAVALAEKNKKVIVIDTDFGGANIHSFFGLKKKTSSLNLFFEDKEPLQNLIIETDIKNLSIIPGDYNSITIDSIKYMQKLKLLRHIKKLEADYILLDLGAGSTFNTIDFFLLADRLTVVTVPEITAIENLFQFIRNTYFRKLFFLLGVYGLKNKAKNIWKNRKKHKITNIIGLIDFIKTELDDNPAILAELSDFSINIILNKLRNSSEIDQGFSIRSLCLKYLGVNALFTGYVEYDFQFWKNLSLIQPNSNINISPRIKKEIFQITENIINEKQIKIGTARYG